MSEAMANGGSHGGIPVRPRRPIEDPPTPLLGRLVGTGQGGGAIKFQNPGLGAPWASRDPPGGSLTSPENFEKIAKFREKVEIFRKIRTFWSKF